MKYEYLQSLIAYYIQRQNIVMLAMLDLNPRVLAMADESIAGIKLQPYIENYFERIKHIENPISLHYGIWKSEWKYRVHGIGCELIHVSSGEPLEWDAPDLDAFRFDWFWRHLIWRCQSDKEDPYVAAVSSWFSTAAYAAVEKEVMDQRIIKIDIDGLARLGV